MGEFGWLVEVFLVVLFGFGFLNGVFFDFFFLFVFFSGKEKNNFSFGIHA